MIPIFLLWMYVTWVIVLVGAEVAFAHEHVSTYGDERRARDASQATRELLALRIMSEVVRRFLDSAPAPTTGELSEEMQAPLRLTNELSDELVEVNLLCRTEVDGRLVPAHDPKRTHPNDVLCALRARGTSGRWPRQDETTQALEVGLARSEQAARAAWKDLTMADLAPAPGGGT